MPYPVAVVEIAFTDGPYVVSPTWTDVTSYVRGMDISRGIPDDWTLQADGSATVTLSNRDRRFDPFNTTGPYYGNLLPRRQIRIRATHLGTTYDVFRGFIAGWPPEWTDAGKDSTVTLRCFDALQLLGSSSMPADWARPYILGFSPRHYFELDDPITWYRSADLTLVDSGSAPSKLLVPSGTAFPGSRIATGLPSQSLGSDFSQGAATSGLVNVAPSTTSSFTAMYWCRGTSADTLASQFGGNMFGGSLEMYLDTNVNGTDYGKFFVTFNNTIRTYKWETTARYEPSEPHHFAFTYDNGTGAGKIYIDGIDVTSARSDNAGVAVLAYETFSLGRGEFQQLALIPSILTQTQVQEAVRLSDAQYPETSSARVTRIIGNTQFSSSLVSTPASPASDVLALTPDAPTATSELTKVSNSEFAPMFVNKAGTLTLYSQSQIRTQTKSIVPQAEYGNGVGFMGNSIGTEVQLQYDGDSMRNVANVEMSGGGVYIQENTTSSTTYGEAEQFIATQVQTIEDADQVADIIVGWGGQVYAKASPVSVVLSPTASWASTLGLELFDRFTLQVTPPSGNAITTPMLASRIAHSVSPERWVTTLEGSARWAAVFILNQSRLGGTDLLG
jgi:hypothetical protein